MKGQNDKKKRVGYAKMLSCEKLKKKEEVVCALPCPASQTDKTCKMCPDLKSQMIKAIWL